MCELSRANAGANFVEDTEYDGLILLNVFGIPSQVEAAADICSAGQQGKVGHNVFQGLYFCKRQVKPQECLMPPHEQ
jgi:hypothetical protein